MRKGYAAAGSAVFFIVAPGVVAGLIPFWLTGWRMQQGWLLLRVTGVVLAVAGVFVLLDCFRRFAGEGRGTPAPVAPTERLVVGGAYRFVRNPMYVAVLAAILGQALLLGQPVLLAYGAAVLIAVVSFVRLYEEPVLHDRYGAAYDEYRRAVPGWFPRLTPWQGGGAGRG
jgi:protein-S-isoprenylcysteine O-methyltransferase Ste14